MAVGAKWNILQDSIRAPLTGTLLFNPIMGHVQLACTSPILAPGIVGSLRYDVNLHSFDADLAAGLLYSTHSGDRVESTTITFDPEGAKQELSIPAINSSSINSINTDQNKPPLPVSTSSLRLRASWRHGLAFSVLSQVMDGTIGVEVGISTGPLLIITGGGATVSIPRPVFLTSPSIGISLSLGS